MKTETYKKLGNYLKEQGFPSLSKLLDETNIEEDGRLYRVTKEDVTGEVNLEVEIAKLESEIDEKKEKLKSYKKVYGKQETGRVVEA